MDTPAPKVLARTVLALIVAGLSANAPRPAGAVASRFPYRCFFDRVSADLAPRCRQVIVGTVTSWQREREGRELKSDHIDPKDPYAPPYTARLQIRGYAPDAGAPQVADRLSIRRAAAVAAELTRLGIPDDLVTVIGFGDRRPLLPDALDPGNRLVEIVLY